MASAYPYSILHTDGTSGKRVCDCRALSRLSHEDDFVRGGPVDHLQNVWASPWFPRGQPHPLILASASPRRRDLLTQIGLRFEQVAGDADESWPEGLGPEAAVADIALRKASAAAESRAGGIVLAADTEVILGGKPLGKPESERDAMSMLRRLVGRKHRVVTGVALVDLVTGRRLTGAASTDVWMRPAADEELAAYVASGEPLDKAGAYGIQGLGAGLVTRIDGCYFNVVGLPIHVVIESLQRLDRSRRIAQ